MFSLHRAQFFMCGFSNKSLPCPAALSQGSRSASVEIYISPASIIHAKHDKLDRKEWNGEESLIDGRKKIVFSLKMKMKINFDFDAKRIFIRMMICL